MGWKNSLGNGVGVNTISSGLEGAWTTNPAKWDVEFLENLFKYDWELTKSPAGAQQWKPKNGASAGTVPDAHDPSKKHSLTMLTSDLGLRFDASYEKISRDYLANPEKFAEAFAKAWYKLTHRDMGPIARYLGPLVPKEQLIWQDPVPAVDHELIGEAEAATEGEDSCFGIVDPATGVDGVGFGFDLPWQRQARRSQRSADSTCTAEALGG